MSDIRGDVGWVGIDLGTQSVRVLLVGEGDDEPLVAARPLHGTRALGRHEQDPEQWWAATCSALHEVVARSPAPASIGALAVSGTSGSVLLTDPHGIPRTPALMYDDSRATAQAARADRFGRQQWVEQGIRIGPSWALAKLLWWVESGHVAAADRLAHQADHIAARLVGSPVPADTSNALKTGADPEHARWPGAILSGLGIPAEVLPELTTPGSILGRVGAAATEQTGLPAGVPVVAGMTDGCAAQIAAGAVRGGSWNSVLGTTLVLKGVSDTRRPDPSGAVYCHRAPFGSAGALTWYPGGASSAGAGGLTTQFPDGDFAGLSEQAGRLEEVDAVRMAYPLTGAGERFPFVAPEAYGHIDGVPLDSDPCPPAQRAQRFLALTHAVARVERLSFDLLDLLGYDVSGPVTLTGGAARNLWWNQLRADQLGVAVHVPRTGEGALGMAILARAAVTDPTPEGLAESVQQLGPESLALQPDPQRGAGLIPGYCEFVEDLRGRGWIGADLAERALDRVAS